MPFPDTKRVVFEHSPLEQVVCQLRFPPILRIDSTPPADFQEKIRAKFPNYSESIDFKLEMPFGIGENAPPEMVRQVMQSSGVKNHEFLSEDEKLKINLTRNFLSLTTTEYHRWEHFIENFRLPVSALTEYYQPTNFSRIGLRYIDVFRRSKLGLEGVPWKELLNPALIGLLGSPETANSVDGFETVQVIKLADNAGMVRIRAKIIIDDTEQIFILDGDFFNSTQNETTDAIDVLNSLNLKATRFLRWSIQDQLFKALGPTDL